MKDERRDTRLYLFLLRAYPRRFRERYRKLMAEAFVSDLRRARGLSVLHVWIHTIFDFFGTLGQEWSRSFQEWWNDRKQKENPPVEANGMMRGVFQDVRLGIRALGRNPGFTAVAALLLALGIGANTTIFTVVNGCFFAPPPGVTEPDRLVRLNLTTPEGSAQWWSHPDYAFYREHNEAFSDLCAYEPDGMVVTARTGDRNVSIRAWYVSQNYFDVLGIRPEIGRTFAPEEGRSAGTHAVAVMSYGLWHRLFGGDPEAIGASLRLNGHPFTIVGVVPEHFHGTSPVEPAPDLWIPTMMQPVLTPTGPDWLERVEDERIDWLQVLGRLPRGCVARGGSSEYGRDFHVSSRGVSSASVVPRGPRGGALATLPVRARRSGLSRQPRSDLDGGRRLGSSHCLRQRGHLAFGSGFGSAG